ncbi:hypothetical protein DQ04_04091020 [Trypanosoma grayi]|uniref:hypothetical protein n=1 Tax=Trypanosoma grayi TaxID=71804 RepID=UPI0004F3F32B|nr:hypothetical protein DQ04_04091020 [Trypanosoma grayi]KEG10168.1 hypothetical protein DQ04_04091020 [Trypanosoma grayi]
MTTLSNEEEELARAAMEENERLHRMLHESANGGHTNDESGERNVERSDSIFSLRRRIDVLKGEIANLQNEIMASDVSGVETIHEFNRLQAKRAHLRNEIQGLRNIKIHQTPKVREANRLADDQQKLKRLSDEKNRVIKEEIRELKEQREKEMEQLYIALRKEAHLKDQLESTVLPLHIHDRQALKGAIALKDNTIQKLEEEIGRTRIARSNRHDRDENNEGDLARLRQEYIELCDNLQTLRRESGCM